MCSLELFPENLTLYGILMDIIPVLALITAAVYYITISRNTIRTRKAQLFMNLYSHFRDKDFMLQWSEKFFKWSWKDFDDYLEKYGPEKNLEAFASYSSTCAYFEGIGVLVKKKLIDLTIVEELMATPIIWMWEKTESVTKGYRERFNAPQLWEWYEYLYNEMKKLA